MAKQKNKKTAVKKQQQMRADAQRLEEYKTLRAEMMQSQSMRMQIVGFSVAFLGVLLGLARYQAPPTETDPAAGAVAASNPWAVFESLALIGLIGALIMTIKLTQGMDKTQRYLIDHIEAKMAGLNWETTSRASRAEAGKKSGSALPGMSAAFAGFYGLLIIGITIHGVVNAIESETYASLAPLLFLAALAGLLCVDLFLKKFLPGWT